MELIHLTSGAISLESIREQIALFAVTCNCSLLTKDSSKFWRDSLPHSLICQSLMQPVTRTPCSVSVRRKQARPHKNCISWRLVTLHRVNKRSRGLLISKFNRMEISQYWCKTAQNTVFSLSSQSMVSCTCMRFQLPLFFTDKRSLINSVLSQRGMPTLMAWLSSTELDKSFQLMLKKTIWFHTSTLWTSSLIIRTFLSNLHKDFLYQEQMISFYSCSTKSLLLQTMLVLLRLQKMPQVLFLETWTLSTSSRPCLKQEVLHHCSFTSMLW